VSLRHTKAYVKQNRRSKFAFFHRKINRMLAPRYGAKTPPRSATFRVEKVEIREHRCTKTPRIKTGRQALPMFPVFREAPSTRPVMKDASKTLRVHEIRFFCAQHSTHGETIVPLEHGALVGFTHPAYCVAGTSAAGTPGCCAGCWAGCWAGGCAAGPGGMLPMGCRR